MPNDPYGWVGTVLDGKVRVDSVVGEGGFAMVYKGIHLGFNEPVGIKILKLPTTISLQEREKFQQSFAEEGRLLYRLSRATSNIVQAHDIGFASSPNGAWCPYLLLEWLEGMALDEDLWQRSQRGERSRTLEQAVALLAPAAEALAIAHEMHVSHRDIKPANLFLAEVGERRTLKVLDFGIAKVMTESEAISKALQATSGTGTTFTPLYASPEHFSRNYGATGPWTDVFALALVLIEVATGKPALDASNLTALFKSVTDPAKRPSLRAQGVATSPELEAVLTTALAVGPRDRYLTARAFWNELQSAMQPKSQPVVSVIAESSASSPMPVEQQRGLGGTLIVTYDRSGPAAHQPTPQPRSAAPRNRLRLVLAIGAAALLLGALLATSAALVLGWLG